jgi:hypothetical protein
MVARHAESRHDVNKQLSFALYGAANRLVRMHKPFLEPLGLTFPQYLVMLELLGDAPRSVGELGSEWTPARSRRSSSVSSCPSSSLVGATPVTSAASSST